MESGMIYANICTKGYIWDFTGIKNLWNKKKEIPPAKQQENNVFYY